MKKLYEELGKRAGYIDMESWSLKKNILKDDMEGIECRIFELEDDIKLAREVLEKIKEYEEGEE